MNRQQLYDILSQPGRPDAAQDLAYARELTENFPWFPLPYQVLAKIYHDQDSIYYDKSLKLAAAYAGSRALLQAYIKTPAQADTIVPAEIPAETPAPLPVAVEPAAAEPAIPLPAIIEEPAAEPVPLSSFVIHTPEPEAEPAAPHIEEAPEAVPAEETEPAVNEPISEPEIPAETTDTEEHTSENRDAEETPAVPVFSLSRIVIHQLPVTETAPEPEQHETEDNQITDEEPGAEELHYAEPVSAVIEAELQEPETDFTIKEEGTAPAPATEEAAEEQEVDAKEISPVENLAEEAPAQDADAYHTAAPEPEPAKKPVHEVLNYGIGGDYLSQFYKESPPKKTEARPAASADFKAPHRFTEWLDMLKNGPAPAAAPQPEPAAPEPEKAQENDVMSLIDKFIQNEPRIQRPQQKMYKPEDMARQSVREDNNLVTETLANIYVKQGLKQKAIEIFQQLILKYPAKSDYFAGKIREIESEGL